MLRIITAVLALACLSGCQQTTRKKLIIATGPRATTNYTVGNILVEAVNDSPHYLLSTDTTEEGSLARVNTLLKSKVDFALVQNDIVLPDTVSDRLRTVMPLYQQVLFILYDSTIQPRSLVDLMHHRRIGVGPRHSGVQAFIKKLLHEFHVDTNRCNFVYAAYDKNVLSDSIEVCCLLTGFNNSTLNYMLDEKRARIWSFDAVDQLGRGASAEGFCMKYPYASPYVIPVGLYRGYPDKSLLTLAVSNILVTQKSMDEIAVYDLVKLFYERHEMMVNRSVLFAGMKGLDEALVTRFPLHDGTRMYLERDRPTFFERYAEVIGLFVTLMTVFASAIFGYVQLRTLQSDRRREKVHFKLFDLQRRLEFTYDAPTLAEIEIELRSLWKSFLEAADKRMIRVDHNFHELRNAFKETEDELHRKKLESADKAE